MPVASPLLPEPARQVGSTGMATRAKSSACAWRCRQRLQSVAGEQSQGPGFKEPVRVRPKPVRAAALGARLCLEL